MGNNLPTSPKRPPPVPPKPHTSLKQRSHTIDNPHCFTSKSEQLYEIVEKNLNMLSDSKPIGTVVNEFSPHLPLCFAVSESMYGICEDRSLMEGQLLSVHFIKEMKVLVIKANQSGNEYTLPLCSSLMVSLLYNPEGKPDTAKKGYTFNEVEEVLNANPMPKIVCALTSFEDMEKNPVEKNDILFIQAISDYENSDCLLCTNMFSGKSLKVGKGCGGKFTTAAEKIKMPLTKLVEFISLPADVSFSSPSDGSIVLPQSAISSFYTILSEKEEKSVIVSTKYMSEESCTVETVEIFLSVSLEVQLVELPSKDLEKLRKESQMLYNNFRPSDVSKVICDLDSSINYVQTALYKAIRKGSWTDGVTLVRPKPPGLQTENKSDAAPIDDEEYIRMDEFQSEVEEYRSKITPNQKVLPAPSPKIPPSSNRPHGPVELQHSLSSPAGKQYSPVSHREYSPAGKQYSPVSHRDSPASYRHSPTTSYKHSPASYQHSPEMVPLNKMSTFPRSTMKTPAPRLPIRKTSDDETISPYMIATRKDGSNALEHERPYDYVKFSQNRDLQLMVLEKELQDMKREKEKSEYGSLNPVGKPACLADVGESL